MPAAHYQCGGVITDPDGRTASPGLSPSAKSPAPACTAPTGSPAIRCSRPSSSPIAPPQPSSAKKRRRRRTDIPPWESGAAQDPDELVVIYHNWDEIRQLYVGLRRHRAHDQAPEARREPASRLSEEVRDYYWNYKMSRDLIELRNLVLVASLIVDSALARHESRGLHFTLDYPETDTNAPPTDTVLRPD